VVATPNDQRAKWDALISKGMDAATGAALERLKTEEAVGAEFDRVMVKVSTAVQGEQNDIAALVLHAALVAILDTATKEGLVQ